MKKSLSIVLFAAVFLLPCVVLAKPFANEALPGIVLCEVKSYGESDIRQELFFSLRDFVFDDLCNCGKFRVEPKLTIDPVLPNGERVQLDKFFSNVHMEAISRSPAFEEADANEELQRYSKSVIRTGGEDGDVYLLSSFLREKVKEIGNVHRAKYLLFCNLKTADSYKTEGVEISDFHRSEGTRVRIELDYYLVNTENGKVFEGRDEGGKSSNTLGLGNLLTFGKQLTVEDMYHKTLDKMSRNLVKTIIKKGVKAVA